MPTHAVHSPVRPSEQGIPAGPAQIHVYTCLWTCTNAMSMLKLNNKLKLKDIQLIGSNHLPREVRETPCPRHIKLCWHQLHVGVRKGSVLGDLGRQTESLRHF